MTPLEKQFDRLCNSRHGYLMIPVVGIGAVGFIVLVHHILVYITP